MRKHTKLAEIRNLRAGEQGWLCYYCDFPMWERDPNAFSKHYKIGKKLALHFQCTAEHLRPVQEGGRNEWENIVAACKFCNHTRHKRRKALSPEKYRQYVQERIRAGRWHPSRLQGLSIFRKRYRGATGTNVLTHKRQ